MGDNLRGARDWDNGTAELSGFHILVHVLSMEERLRGSCVSEIKEELNWFKKAKLIWRFHLLMTETKGKKRGQKWTLHDSARVLDLSIGYVSESLNLAHHDELKNLSRHHALVALRNNGKS